MIIETLKKYLWEWTKLGLKKAPLVIIGWIYIPIMLWRKVDIKTAKIWGNWEGVPAGENKYTYLAFRNPVHNLIKLPMPKFTQVDNMPASDAPGDPMELPGTWWRIRTSEDGQYASLRVTFGKAKSKGKAEFYIGHKMRDKDKIMGFTFFQLRPVILFIPVLTAIFVPIALLVRFLLHLTGVLQ